MNSLESLMSKQQFLRKKDLKSKFSLNHRIRNRHATTNIQRITGGMAEVKSEKSPPLDSNAKHIYENINMPSCPKEYLEFINSSSLEKLIFWKLEKLIENLSLNSNYDEDFKLLEKVLSHVEKPLFALVLRKTSGNLSTAAKFLGCNRNTLHRKLKELKISPKDLRQILRQGKLKHLVGILEE